VGFDGLVIHCPGTHCASSFRAHSQAVQVALAATIANALCMTAAISATIGVFLVPIAQDSAGRAPGFRACSG
jgi:hypothetical protein